MGTWLIFQGLLEVTNSEVVSVLIGLDVALEEFQEIAPAYRPYPKPTQVDR